MKMNCIESPRARIRRHPNPAECWLWCYQCRRFFQYKNARPSELYRHDACPFSNCHGHGLGFHLFWWDDMREPDDPRWPSSTEELSFGLASPEMEPFYAAQLKARIHRLVSGFAACPELAATPDGPPARYLGSFLKMMSDLCWDLTNVEADIGFDAEIAPEIVGELPVWSRTADPNEAVRMVAELRAFFAFAERTACVRDADQWRRFFEVEDVVELFRTTMRIDHRLADVRLGRVSGGRTRERKRRRRARGRR